MQTVQFVTIDINNLEQRIDNFLQSKLKKVPKSHIYKIIRKGEVRINKKRIKPTYKLQINDIVRIPPIKLFVNKPHTASNNLRKILQESILFEDKTMIVLNKPEGLAVHGGSGINLGVIEALRQIYPNHYLELVHRLDRDTSGCLIIAKQRSFLRHLQNEIRQRLMIKKYLVILTGQFDQTIKCNQPLLKTTNNSGEWRVSVDKMGKNAMSIFIAKKQLNNRLILSEVEILTGRTHQIRVHADFIKHPVLGDEKYGNQEINTYYKKLGLKRMYLHAHSLSFRLANGQQFQIEAPCNFDDFCNLA